MPKWLVAALSLPLLLPAAFAQPKWTLQYFYDEDGKDLRIADLAFPSADRGVAVGEIVGREGRKPQYTALVTSDGGAHWSLVPLKEFPRSIFFLNENAGWLVTSESIWFTAEAGRSWTRIGGQIRADRKLADAPRTGLLLRLWFLDAQHGYGVGLQKSVYETRDGGRTWKPVAEAAQPGANPAYSVYSRIAFADARRGVIVGGYVPPRPGRRPEDDMPDWVSPERALARRERPLLTIEMDTRDGGATWTPSTAPVIGSVASLRLGGSDGLAVFAYADSFDWPSEVYRLDLATGASTSVFKQKDRRVTDTLLFADGRAFLAAAEPPGKLRSAPVPGKVKMLTSADLTHWTEMRVDYRAVAQSLVLAGPDASHVWAATDTGMILRLSGSAPAN